MMRYMSSAYLHNKFPETLVKIGPVCSVIILVIKIVKKERRIICRMYVKT